MKSLRGSSIRNPYNLSSEELSAKRVWDKLHSLKKLELLTGAGRMDYDEAIRYQDSSWNGLPTITQTNIIEYYDLKKSGKKRYY